MGQNFDENLWLQSLLYDDNEEVDADNLDEKKKEVAENAVTLSPEADYKHLYEQVCKEYNILAEATEAVAKENQILEMELKSSESRLKEILKQKCSDVQEDFFTSWNRREKLENLILERDALKRDLEQHQELLKVHSVNNLELHSLQKEMLKKTARINKLDAENKTLRNDCAIFKKQATRVETVQNQNATLHTELTHIQAEHASLLKEKETWKNKIDELNRIIFQKDSHLLGLKNENLNLERQIMEMKVPNLPRNHEDNGFLSKQQQILQEERNQIQREYISMMKELESWKTKVGELTQVISEKASDVTKVQTVKEVLLQKDQVDSCISCHQQKDELNKQYEKLQFQLEQIQKAQYPYLKEKDLLNMKLEELNKTMCDKGNDLVELRKENSSLNIQIVDLKNAILGLNMYSDHELLSPRVSKLNEELDVTNAEDHVPKTSEYHDIPSSPVSCDEVPSSTSETISPINAAPKVSDELTRRLDEARCYKKEMHHLRFLVSQFVSPLHKKNRQKRTICDNSEPPVLQDTLERPSKKRNIYLEQYEMPVLKVISTLSPQLLETKLKGKSMKCNNVQAAFENEHSESCDKINSDSSHNHDFNNTQDDFILTNRIAVSPPCDNSQNKGDSSILNNSSVSSLNQNTSKIVNSILNNSAVVNSASDLNQNINRTETNKSLENGIILTRSFSIQNNNDSIYNKNKKAVVNFTPAINTTKNVSEVQKSGIVNGNAIPSFVSVTPNISKVGGSNLTSKAIINLAQNSRQIENGGNNKITKNSASSRVTKMKKKKKQKSNKKRRSAGVMQTCPVASNSKLVSALEQLETLRFRKNRLSKCCSDLVRVLIDPSAVDSINTIVFEIVHNLSQSKRNPLMSFMEDFNTNILIPVSEKCIVNAMIQVDAKKKINLQGLIPELLQHLKQRAIEDKVITLYGTSALCRVLTLICKKINQMEFLRSFCFDLLKDRGDIAHYVIASMLGVWYQFLLSDEQKLGFINKAWNYILTSRPDHVSDTQWCQCQAVFQHRQMFKCSDYPSLVVSQIGYYMSEADSDQSKITECAKILEIFAIKEGWEWCKEFLLRRVILIGISAWNDRRQNVQGFTAFVRLINCIDQLSPDNDDTCVVFVDTHLRTVSSSSKPSDAALLDKVVQKCKQDVWLRHKKTVPSVVF